MNAPTRREKAAEHARYPTMTSSRVETDISRNLRAENGQMGDYDRSP
jgi:hypothetical protein